MKYEILLRFCDLHTSRPFVILNTVKNLIFKPFPRREILRYRSG